MKLGLVNQVLRFLAGVAAEEPTGAKAHADLGEDVPALGVVVQEKNSSLLQVDPSLWIELGHPAVRSIAILAHRDGVSGPFPGWLMVVRLK